MEQHFSKSGGTTPWSKDGWNRKDLCHVSTLILRKMPGMLSGLNGLWGSNFSRFFFTPELVKMLLVCGYAPCLGFFLFHLTWGTQWLNEWGGDRKNRIKLSMNEFSFLNRVYKWKTSFWFQIGNTNILLTQILSLRKLEFKWLYVVGLSTGPLGGIFNFFKTFSENKGVVGY